MGGGFDPLPGTEQLGNGGRLQAEVLPSTTTSSNQTGGGKALVRMRAGSTIASPPLVANHRRPSGVVQAEG